jgi:hypothetical protein
MMRPAKELRRCAGRQFVPMLVEHFVTVAIVRDDTRRADDSAVPNLNKLETGRKVESLLNTEKGYSDDL